MAKSKVQVVKIKFERVPVEVAKKIAEQQDRAIPITCGVCGDPVNLENCRTDEHGKAVHQNCYIAGILQETGKKVVRPRARLRAATAK
jgi:hypothetical protein